MDNTLTCGCPFFFLEVCVCEQSGVYAIAIRHGGGPCQQWERGNEGGRAGPSEGQNAIISHFCSLAKAIPLQAAGGGGPTRPEGLLLGSRLFKTLELPFFLPMVFKFP